MTPSRPGLLTVEEALSQINKHMPLWTGFGELTAEPLIADRDYPPFNRVMMDGIALCHQTFINGQRKFPIVGVVAAGTPQKELTNPLACWEVMTGAPMPLGADLVIPYEQVTVAEGFAHITGEQERALMEHVHCQGVDFRQGMSVLNAGAILNGPHRGIAASLGYSSPRMNKKPRINIISTGDELVEIDKTPLAHQIRRSNAHALAASLKLYGYCDVILSHLADNKEDIAGHYLDHVRHFDLMIYSGGVSMGKFDYLPGMWKSLGATECFHGVSQKPGKPLWFGIDEKNQTAILGLPGNPVSSLVCLHKYLLSRKEIHAQLAEDLSFRNNLTRFIPARLEFSKSGILIAHPINIKNSGEFAALADSDGFVELAKDQTLFKKDETCIFHPWRPL